MRSKKRSESYASYIYKVLKKLNKTQSGTKYEDVGISSNAMKIMVAFVDDCFRRIATEAGRLASKNGSKTLGAREIQTAVRLLVPPGFARYAISEGTKAAERIDPKATSEYTGEFYRLA